MLIYDKMVATIGSEHVPMPDDYKDAVEFFDRYMEWTDTTAKYPDPTNNLLYPFFGLLGETAEFFDKFDDFATTEDSSEEQETSLTKEFGDIFWYVARIAKYFGVSLGEIIGMAQLLADGSMQISKIMVIKEKQNPSDVMNHINNLLNRRFMQGMEALKKIERGDTENNPEKREEKMVNGLMGVSALLATAIFSYSVLFAPQGKATIPAEEIKRVCTLNKEKLMSRLQDNTIKGDGDER